jgi:hypothetical protein
LDDEDTTDSSESDADDTADASAFEEDERQEELLRKGKSRTPEVFEREQDTDGMQRRNQPSRGLPSPRVLFKPRNDERSMQIETKVKPGDSFWSL